MTVVNIEQLSKGKGKQQLVCFPYLGGHAASFHQLSSYLSQDFEIWAINPPGHGQNHAPLIEDMEELVKLIVKELRPLLRDNAIFLGHSLGGVVAYYTAYYLNQLADEEYNSLTLILSACNCPDTFSDKSYSELPFDELLDHLIGYGGIPEELLQEREMLQFFMPMIRADFRLLQSASLINSAPLSVSTYYMWGTEDSMVDLYAVLRWSTYVNQDITLIPIAGGAHMFITKQADQVAKHISQLSLDSVMHRY